MLQSPNNSKMIFKDICKWKKTKKVKLQNILKSSFSTFDCDSVIGGITMREAKIKVLDIQLQERENKLWDIKRCCQHIKNLILRYWHDKIKYLIFYWFPKNSSHFISCGKGSQLGRERKWKETHIQNSKRCNTYEGQCQAKPGGFCWFRRKINNILFYAWILCIRCKDRGEAYAAHNICNLTVFEKVAEFMLVKKK